MDAFKIDKSKIEALNTRYKEKAKVFPADIICLGYCKMERNIFVHFQKKNYSVL